MESFREIANNVITNPIVPVTGFIGLADRLVEGEYDTFEGILKFSCYSLWQAVTVASIGAYLFDKF